MKHRVAGADEVGLGRVCRSFGQEADSLVLRERCRVDKKELEVGPPFDRLYHRQLSEFDVEPFLPSINFFRRTTACSVPKQLLIINFVFFQSLV